MIGEVLKIIFKDDRAFLTKQVPLDFTHVEIPAGSKKFKAPAFWTIRVINHIKSERKLFVEVLDYCIGETEFSYDQIQLEDTLIEIEKVTFKSIDTPGWLNTLNGIKPGKFMPSKSETVYRQETTVKVPVKRIYNKPFSVAIKDVKFLSGKIAFEKKIQQLGKSIKFEIFNENIIEQYDAIKNYFANVLKTKRIQVTPMITTVDGVIESTSAASVEIEKIDQTLIQEVKFEVVKATRKKEVPGDEQLFTKDEYVAAFVDEDAQQLFKDDNDLFETLLEKYGKKHHDHLKFLSSKHKHDLQKLRFVHNPFSFVFVLQGNNKFHIVWETLDTAEATYIWTYGNDQKDLPEILANTDKIIGLILKEGKNGYLNQLEENFNRVFHVYSDLHNGFKNWKADLEKLIM